MCLLTSKYMTLHLNSDMYALLNNLNGKECADFTV